MEKVGRSFIVPLLRFRVTGLVKQEKTRLNMQKVGVAGGVTRGCEGLVEMQP